jgi:hypothetical protein
LSFVLSGTADSIEIEILDSLDGLPTFANGRTAPVANRRAEYHPVPPSPPSVTEFREPQQADLLVDRRSL